MKHTPDFDFDSLPVLDADPSGISPSTEAAPMPSADGQAAPAQNASTPDFDFDSLPVLEEPVAQIQTMSPKDFKGQPNMGGATEQALMTQAQGGPVAEKDDGSISSWLKNAWNAFAHNASGRIASSDINWKTQRVMEGAAEKEGGKRVSFLDLPDAELDDYMNSIAPNGFWGYVGNAIGMGGRNDLMKEWDETQGAKIADPAERKKARVQYAMDVAKGVFQQTEEQKQFAQAELQGRGKQWQSDITGGAIQMAGYMAPALAPVVGMPLSAAVEGAARRNELLSDKYETDAEGNVYKVAQGDTRGSALVRGAIGGTVQAAVENYAGKVARKIIGKIPGVAKAGDKVMSTAIGKAVGKFYRPFGKFFEKTGLDDAPSEFLEEFAQTAIDSTFGLDRRQSEMPDGMVSLERGLDATVDLVKNSGNLLESMLLVQLAGGGLAHMKNRLDANRILRDVVKVDPKKLKGYSTETKWRLIDNHFNGMSEEQKVKVLEAGAKEVDNLLHTIEKERLDSFEGRLQTVQAHKDAAKRIYEAREQGKDVSRRMLQEMGIDTELYPTVAERNALADRFLEDRTTYKMRQEAEAAIRRTKMDEVQRGALADEITSLGIDAESKEYGGIWLNVANQISDAKELDDPVRRAELVQNALEKYVKENGELNVQFTTDDGATHERSWTYNPPKKETTDETRTDEALPPTEQGAVGTQPSEGQAAVAVPQGAQSAEADGVVDGAETPKTAPTSAPSAEGAITQPKATESAEGGISQSDGAITPEQAAAERKKGKRIPKTAVKTEAKEESAPAPAPVQPTQPAAKPQTVKEATAEFITAHTKTDEKSGKRVPNDDINRLGELTPPTPYIGKTHGKIEKPKKVTDEASAVGVMKDIAAHDGVRQSYGNLHVENGTMVATNGSMAMVAPAPKGLNDGNYKAAKRGDPNAGFPQNWKQVIPNISGKKSSYSRVGVIENGDKSVGAIEYADSVSAAMKRMDKESGHVTVKVGDAFINPEYMRKTTRAMFRLGVGNIEVFASGAYARIVLKGRNANGEVTGVIMPLRYVGHGDAVPDKSTHVRLFGEASQPKAAPTAEGSGAQSPSVGKKAQNTSEQNSLDAYLSNKKPMDAARIRKTLAKKIDFGKDGVMSEAERIEKAKRDGDKITAFVPQLRNGGSGKVTYSLSNGSVISKMAVDYARHIGVKVDENSALRAQEEKDVDKAVKQFNSALKSQGWSGGTLDTLYGDKDIQAAIDRFSRRKYRMKHEDDILAVLNRVRDARIERGDWSLAEEKTEIPSNPAPKAQKAPKLTEDLKKRGIQAARILGVESGMDIPELEKTLKQVSKLDSPAAKRKAQALRDLIEYRKAVGQNTDPQSEESSGGKWRGESMKSLGSFGSPDVKSPLKGDNADNQLANPNLQEEVATALKKDAAGRYVTSGSKTVHFSAPSKILEFLGVPIGNVFTVCDVLQKLERKHHLSVEQIAKLPEYYNDPVAVFVNIDGKGANVILTDLMATTKEGTRNKPVMVLLRPSKRGDGGYIASAYPREISKEEAYVEWKSKLRYLNTNKITEANLEVGTVSRLKPQSLGDDVKTVEEYSSWSTPNKVAHSTSKVNRDEKKSPSNPLGQIVPPEDGSVAQAIDKEIALGVPPSPAPGSATNASLDSDYEPESIGKGIKNPISRQEIVDEFKRLFKDSVAIRGKNTTQIGKQYSGHYEPNSGIIRTKDYTSVSLRTIPHEIGHHIDTQLKRLALARPASVKNELARLGVKLYGAKKPNGGYESEGFAEIIKYYLQGNESGLKKEVPNAYDWLINKFGKADPDTMAKLDDLRDLIDRLQNQSGEDAVRAIRAKDLSAGEKLVMGAKKVGAAAKPTQEHWTNVGAFIDKAMKASGLDKLMDWHSAMKSGDTAKMNEIIENDPRLKWELYTGRAGARAFQSLEGGLMDLSGTRRYTYGDLGVSTPGHSADENIPTFKEIFQDFTAKEMDEFQNYAIARIAKEAYLDKDLMFGLTESEVAPVIAKHADNQKFRKALDQYTHYKHAVLHLLVDSGAMSQEQFDAIVAANPIYVKIARRRESVDFFRNKMLKSRGKAVNKRTGSGRQIEDIFAAGLVDDERIFKAAFQSDILRSLVELGKEGERAGGVKAGYTIGANWIHEVPNAQGAVKFTSEKLRKQIVDAMQKTAVATDKASAENLFDQIFDDGKDTLTIFKEKPSNGKNGVVSIYDQEGRLHTYELPENNAEGWAKGLWSFTDASAPNIIEKIFSMFAASTRSGATVLSPGFAMTNFMKDTLHASIMNEYGTFIPLVSSLRGVVDKAMNSKASQIYDNMALGMGTMLGRSSLPSAKKATKYIQSKNWFERQWNKGVIKWIADVVGYSEDGTRIAAFKNARDYMLKHGASEKAANIIAGANAGDITINFLRGGETVKRINRIVPFFNAGVQGIVQGARAFGLADPKSWSRIQSRKERAARTMGKGIGILMMTALLAELYNHLSDDEEEIKELKPHEKWDKLPIGNFRLPIPHLFGYLFMSLPRAVFYEVYHGDKGAVKECLGMFRKTFPWLSPRDVALLGPTLEVAMNETWSGSPIVSPHVMENRESYDWYTPRTTTFSKALAKAFHTVFGNSKVASPAHLDAFLNKQTGNMYGNVLGLFDGDVGIDSSRPHTYPIVGRFFRSDATSSRLIDDFYSRRDELRRKKGSGKATDEELGKLKYANRVADTLSDLRKQAEYVRKNDSLSDKQKYDELEKIAKIMQNQTRQFLNSK